MPVSKKRKKKTRNKPAGPPPPKSVLATKKKKLTKQQILIYVFSGLIVLSLAISLVVSGLGRGRTPASSQGTPQAPTSLLQEENENASPPGDQDTGQEGSVDATPESDTQN